MSKKNMMPEPWNDWVDEWSADMRLRSLSENTINLRRYQIGAFARHTGKHPGEVTASDIRKWLGRKGLGNAAKRGDRCMFSMFYGWAQRNGKRLDNPVEGMPTIKREQRKKRAAPEQAVLIGRDSSDPRTRLIIMLAADAGLRRAEIAQVRGDDLIDDELGWSLIVPGKGGKDRIVPLSDELAREIRRRGPGWLFPGEKGCDHICGDTVYRLVKDATGYPPHSLRRRFATAAYITSNGNVMAIKELLGHESLATTQGYITVSGRMLRTVIEQARGYEARGTGDG